MSLLNKYLLIIVFSQLVLNSCVQTKKSGTSSSVATPSIYRTGIATSSSPVATPSIYRTGIATSSSPVATPSIYRTGIATSSSAIATKLPYNQYIELTEYINKTITVQNGKFIRLVFPFLLDAPDLFPKLTMAINNNNGFGISSADQMKGQNVILLQSLGGTAQLIINVNGYNITLDLKTNKQAKIINYIFKYNRRKQNALIIKQLQFIKENYQNKLKDLKVQFKQLAIDKSINYFAELTTELPTVTNFKEEINNEKGNTQALLYISRIDNYKNEIYILRYELKINKLSTINSIQIISDGILIEGSHSCDNKSGRDFSCNFATTQKKIISEHKMKIIISFNGATWNYEF